MDEILKKIEEMKTQAQRLIVKVAHDRLDEIANDISEGYITACDELKSFILSMKKEPCEYCSENPCWLCKQAGECRTWQHCAGNNRADYNPIQNYCHICGRSLTPQSIDNQPNKN